MFTELLQNRVGSDPGLEQADARRQFSARVNQSHLQERQPSERIPADGTFVVIGVASYSPDELRLLDEVNANCCQWGKKLNIAVFDVLNCRTMSDFENYMPGIGEVWQTPAIAVWQDGKLLISRTGLFAARQVLEQERAIV